MNVNRGFVTTGEMGLETQMRTAGSLGYDFVELAMWGRGKRERLADETDVVRERLAAEDLDCLVHLPFVGIDAGSPHEHVRAGARRELEACLDVAADLDARKAVVHPESGADDPAEQRRLMADWVAHLDDYAAARGVELCAETRGGGGYVTIVDFDHVVDDTDASVCVDTGHARIAGCDAADTAAFVAEHADRLSHFHLNDTTGPSDHHLAFGAGTIDFGTIFAPLQRADWSGTLSVESRSSQPPYLELSLRQLDALLDGDR